MKKHLAALAAITLSLGLLPAGSAGARTAAPEWQDGTSDADSIYNCVLEDMSTGVSANVGWRSDDGKVPEVGETFYLRGYIGLVGLPCSGRVAVLPELLPPLGLEYAKGPLLWDLQPAGQPQDLDDDPVTFAGGANGGIVIQDADESAFELRQGDVLEFQFPVYATRPMKGPATQRPECEDRREGTAPCPVAQAGDHFQLAFTVGGHGGDKSYVTPYVGLFAQPKVTNPPPAAPVASRTTAAYRVSKARAGSARVTVRSAKPAVGKVVVLDGRRTIGRATMQASHRGTVTVRLPRLAKGRHRLVTKYLGSRTVKASASAPRTVIVR